MLPARNPTISEVRVRERQYAAQLLVLRGMAADDDPADTDLAAFRAMQIEATEGMVAVYAEAARRVEAGEAV